MSVVGDAALCRELVSMDAMTSVMAALASVSSDDEIRPSGDAIVSRELLRVAPTRC